MAEGTSLVEVLSEHDNNNVPALSLQYVKKEFLESKMGERESKIGE